MEGMDGTTGDAPDSNQTNNFFVMANGSGAAGSATYLGDSSNNNRTIRLSESNVYPEDHCPTSGGALNQEGPSNDVTVIAVPTCANENHGGITVAAYPISVIQWNPVQGGNTFYLVGSAQTHTNLNSSGLQAATVQNVQYATVCDTDTIQCVTSAAADTNATILKGGESTVGRSLAYNINGIGVNQSQSFQELPLNLSTTTNQPTQPYITAASDYGTHLREFARFAVDQADTIRGPSSSSAVINTEVVPNCANEQGIIQESFIQTNCHLSDGNSNNIPVSVMCTETDVENLTEGTDTGINYTNNSIVCSENSTEILSKEQEKQDKIEIELGENRDFSKIRLMSTSAGAKTPIVREPPSVTRRINLSCLQSISSIGSTATTPSNSSVTETGVSDIGTRILQTLSDSSSKVISHSIVNITSKNDETKQRNLPMPVRPKPVLGFAGQYIPVSAGNSTNLGTNGRTATVYPIQPALSVSLPPLSVFRAPVRFVPPSVPLLPSRLPTQESRFPVVRTRFIRGRKSAVQKTRRRQSVKCPSSSDELKDSSQLDDDGIQNGDLSEDPQGRNRVDLNARERERVSLLNNGFDCLRRVLPWSTKIGRRVSKVDTLRGAISYIDFLQRLLEETEDVTAFRPVYSGM